MVENITTQKIYLNVDDKAMILCPNCEKGEIKNLAKYKELHMPIKAKCNCGWLFNIVIESRKFYRKETVLSGVYTEHDSDNARKITIENLSFTGIGFKTNFRNNIKLGDISRFAQIWR